MRAERQPTRLEKALTAPPDKLVNLFEVECLTKVRPLDSTRITAGSWRSAFNNLTPLVAGVSMYRLILDNSTHDNSEVTVNAAAQFETLLNFWENKNADGGELYLLEEGQSLFHGLREMIIIFAPRFLKSIDVNVEQIDALKIFREMSALFYDEPRILELLERHALNEKAMAYIEATVDYFRNKKPPVLSS